VRREANAIRTNMNNCMVLVRMAFDERGLGCEKILGLWVNGNLWGILQCVLSSLLLLEEDRLSGLEALLYRPRASVYQCLRLSSEACRC